MMNKRSIVIGLASLVIVASGSWYFSLKYFQGQQIPAPQKKSLILPDGAKPISECRAKLGWYYSTAEDVKGDTAPWTGPTYIVWQPTGKVLGIQYHISREELEKGASSTINNYPFPLPDAYFNHTILKHNSAGHSGFAKPHDDLALFTISPEEKNSLVCPLAQ